MSVINAIRVLQLGSPTGLYGAERWLLALVKHLPKDDIESIVSVIKDDPKYELTLCEHAAQMGIKTHLFEAYGRINFSAIGQLRQFIVDKEITILHTHGYKTDIIGILAVRGTRCKIVSTPHGWSHKAGYKLKAYEMIDRLSFRFFSAVVPLSPELYAGLQDAFGLNGKLRLIPNGVDIAEIDAVTKPARELQDLKDKGHIIIGYIGQLIARKGVDNLLTAFSQLEIKKKRLFIVGDGPLRTELELLAKKLGMEKDVVFCGFRIDRIELLKGFDVFVLPSKLEGIPRCLMEAMAAEIPVIASNISGCTDLVIDGETGLLFEVGQADSLVQKLRELLSSAPKRERLRAGGRSLLIERYSAEIMAKRYADLYIELTRDSPTRKAD